MKTLNRIFTFFGNIFFIGLTIIGAAVLVYILIDFVGTEEESTTLTNAGFAIFIAISSVCFSWARAVNKDNKNINDILECGQRSFASALLFIIGSAFKYAAFKVTDQSMFFWPLIILLISCLLMALIGFIITVISLGLILFNSKNILATPE